MEFMASPITKVSDRAVLKLDQSASIELSCETHHCFLRTPLFVVLDEDIALVLL